MHDYEKWYDEAMHESNAAGYVGVTAAQTITHQAAHITELEAQLAAAKQADRRKDVDRYQWQPIETAPNGDSDIFLVAGIESSRLYWASAAKRGKALLSKLFYTPTGNSISAPTHWMPLPAEEKQA